MSDALTIAPAPDERRCKRGHLLTTAADVYVRPNGERECRTCRREHKAAWVAAHGNPEPMRRKGWAEGTCRNGHDTTDPANVYVTATTGARRCRVCRIEVKARARAAAKGGAS